MKKFFSAIFTLILVLSFAGAAAAEAPYQISLTLTNDDSSNKTVLIAFSGDQISFRLGETNVFLSVEEKQAEGLNFSFDPMLQFNDEHHGKAEIKYFLLPEYTENTFTEVGKDNPSVTISWEHLELPGAYTELIDQVTAVLNGTSEDYSNISPVFRMMAGNDAARNAEFYITDLDKDGTPEMLFGENYPGSESTVFYNLYTIKDGEPVFVFDGWERSRYYLCSNGGIAHEGSSSAFSSFTSLNYYKDGELRLMESVIYDSQADPENPWHISYNSEHEFGENDLLVDETEARSTLSYYPYINVELEPFIQ